MRNKLFTEFTSKNHSNFDSFISVDMNNEAKQIAVEYANGASNYRVLGISSEIGNGATHLAYAILNKIKMNNHTKEILHTSFERLLIYATGDDLHNLFNPKLYQENRVILIDSFYDSSNKSKASEIISIFKESNAKIIFTYTRGLKIPIADKEITLVTPSKIEKEIIIQNILKSLNEELEDEIIDFIANDHSLSVRRIEALVLSTITESKMLNRNINLELVHQIQHQIM